MCTILFCFGAPKVQLNFWIELTNFSLRSNALFCSTGMWLASTCSFFFLSCFPLASTLLCSIFIVKFFYSRVIYSFFLLNFKVSRSNCSSCVSYSALFVATIQLFFSFASQVIYVVNFETSVSNFLLALRALEGLNLFCFVVANLQLISSLACVCLFYLVGAQVFLLARAHLRIFARGCFFSSHTCAARSFCLLHTTHCHGKKKHSGTSNTQTRLLSSLVTISPQNHTHHNQCRFGSNPYLRQLFCHIGQKNISW